MNKQIQVLMVEDDAVDRMAFDRMITAEHPGFLVTFASSFHAAQALLSQQQFDVIVSDFDLGDGDALEVLKIAEDIPVIVVTGAGSEERAVQAMKAGAYDYIVKDTERRYLTLLPLTIENVLKARTAEAQFRMFAHALGSLADSVYICDGNGEIFYVNDAFLERFGYLREEILGQSLEKLLAPENSANLFQDILQKTASGGWQGEVNCLRKDGTPVLVFLSTLPAFNHSHQLLSFSGSIKDISQRKKVEKAFISSTTEEQSISLLMVEDDLVDQMAFKRVVKNEALPYDYTMANCVEEAVLKIESREFDVIVTDYSLGDGNALDILKVAKDIPVIIITGAGDEEIAVEAMKAGAYDYLIKDPHRNYLKTLPLTIKHAINSKASERRFKMLSHALMSINDSVWITDLQDNILFVNEAFLKNYGYEDISEIIGKSIHIVHSESTSAETIQNIQLETMCGGWDGELMSRRKDGSEFPIYLSTSIIYDDNGLPLAFTGVAKDITEQKQAQEELRKAKESAEAANRAKSEFLANVSHEIRTPMNGILGMTELALDTNLDPEQREYLSMVKSSAESLLSIINDILDFSKIEAGKFELRPVEFNLAQNLAELMKPLTLRARQKGVELNYDLASGIPENLIGDPVRLRQIIVNLIGNAIKFTDKGHISFDVTPEWQRDQKICLHFQVKDTGIGVPPEKQDKIFNSFEQADGSFSRSFSGTGLGLAISARLVEMMDGSIWVESPVNPKPGNGEGPGSVFHFLAVFEVPLPIVEEAPIPSLQDLPLLLISDDPTNTNVMLAVLNSWGIKTTHLTHLDSRQRKDFSADWHFKWILVDLLPLNENTHQVLEQIKLLATETRTPVIFASSMENSQNLPMLDGLLTVIQKPIQIDSLKQLLQNLLNQEVKTVEEYPVEENTDECGSYKILLAEDNHVNQKLAQKMLEKLGHQVVVANNGKMALEKLQGEPFDLVIMDIQMPEMDGFEATARIREEEKTSGEHLPIIALTANAMSGDRERCLEAGMDDYLAKPIKKKDLIEVIRKVMRDRVNA